MLRLPWHTSLDPWVKHLLQIGLGLALTAIVLLVGGPVDLRRLTTLEMLPLVGGFVATLAIAASIGLRWHVLTQALLTTPVTQWFRLCHYFLWNRLLGFIVPKDLSDIGGRTASLVMQHGVPLRGAGVSVLMDRGFDVLIMGLLLGPSVLFVANVVGPGTGVALMALLTGGFYVVARCAYGFLADKVVHVYHLFADLASRVPLLARLGLPEVNAFPLSAEGFCRAYALSLAKFLCTAARLAFFASALRIPVSPLTLLMGAPLGQLSFLVAFTPGGLGVFEAGWYAVLAHLGVPGSHISAFLIVQRVLTVLFVGVLALLSKLAIAFFIPEPQT